MDPYVRFTFTEDDCKSLVQSLARQGIKVCPKSRSTLENLEKGGISHTDTTGILVYRDCEFVYHTLQHSKGYKFEVGAFTHGWEVGEALVAAIKEAYPQPEPPSPPRPAPTRKLDKNRIGCTVGCIGILLFIGAVCFFATLGVRNFFK